nr:hypothetical protein [Tanacetum cinerariifolium]
MPPTPDLSFTGLDEFVNKPVVENCKAKSSEEEPKALKKNDDALIIEEYVSDNEEEEGNPQMDLQDQGVIDSGCSRHTTENISNLINYEEIDRGYVAFGGNPKGGKIIGKCTIKTGSGPNWLFDIDALTRTMKYEPIIAGTQSNGFEGRKPALSFMRPFGCPVTILNTIDHLGKFDGKANKGFFVGYSTNSKAFKVFNSRTRIVEENLHVKFSENTPNIAGSGPNWIFEIDALTKSINYKPVVAGNQSNDSAGTKACDIIGEEEKKDAEDSGNEDSKVSNIEEPKVNQEKDSVNNTNRVNAVSSNVNAASNEVNAVGRKLSIELSDDPNMPELEDISIFEDSNEDVFGAEADLNNLESTFQLIAKKRCMYVNHQDLKIQTLLMEYTRLRKDCMDYIKLLELVYVDDIIFGSTKKELCNAFKKLMHEKFQMSSMRELAFFLGLKVKQKKDGIFISQDKYVAEILKKFMFTEVKTASTSMETQKHLLKDEDGEEVDIHMYRSMIGSLMYLTSLRPDIMFVVCACARYQVNPKVSHLYVVKRVFRSINGEVQLHAQVDGKEIVITESSVRRDLQLADEEDKAVHKEFDDNLVRAATTASSLKVEQEVLKRLYKVGLSARVESCGDEESLGEDASKQGMRIDAIDADEDITLVNDVDNEMFDIDYLGGEEVFVIGKNYNVVEEVVNAAQVSIAATTVTITTKEITLAQSLEALKTSKPKEKKKENEKKKEQEQEITKKQKVDDDKEKKIHKEGKKRHYQTVRADEKSQMYMIFSQMLKSFDKEDLEDLYKLSTFVDDAVYADLLVGRKEGGQGRGNNGNQARGLGFMMGAEEAHQDPNMMTDIEPNNLGFSNEIEIASGQLVEINKSLRRKPEEKVRYQMSAKTKEQNLNDIIIVRNFPEGAE